MRLYVSLAIVVICYIIIHVFKIVPSIVKVAQLLMVKMYAHFADQIITVNY